ncbi:MAG: ABC transporter permease, partial [Candidatus Eisenbacteria bacterium]|nr:ABC transporter permease [Candidatus Eisenbacteria bacterium]
MFREAVRLAVGNVSRAKLRYVLTALGIMIGTGAIVSMVSFSVGMQREISEAVSSSGLLTTVYVTPGRGVSERTDPADADDAGREEEQSGVGAADSTGRDPAIDDSLLARISALDGVMHAFPLVAFPAILTRGRHQAFATVSGLPTVVNESTRKRLNAGATFVSETDSSLIATASLARRLGVSPDSLSAPVPVTLSVAALSGKPSPLMAFGLGMPFERRTYRLNLVGVLKQGMMGPAGRTDAYIPLGIARDVSTFALRGAQEILRNISAQSGGYPGAEVHVAKLEDVERVVRQVEGMGLSTFSISEQLKEMRTVFVVMSGFLGAIGGVALFVGCLGIMNIMLISVFERTRDIGVMKSVGARQRDVLNLFVIEAGMVGVVGGLSGVLLGLGVAEVANRLMFAFVVKGEMPYHQLYSIPAWLAAGAVGLAVGVSVLAGLYPARRAARLDPVAALRYE